MDEVDCEKMCEINSKHAHCHSHHDACKFHKKLGGLLWAFSYERKEEKLQVKHSSCL
jgi:hypothetical protein